MNHLEDLNDAQKAAVLATAGPVSVLAGAGSGKTKVLTTRIYHLIKEGVPAEKILAVTFTNKAAREMRERLSRLLHGGRPPFIATFHGLGRELLESYGAKIGVPRHFTIFDRDDSQKAIGKALKELDVDTKELSPRAVLSRISKAKGAGETAESFYAEHGRKSFGGRIVAEAWLRYEKTLREEKALDFDDLISLPVRLLREHEDVRALAQERWDYLHIDEFQDTNALQGTLVGMLSRRHGNVFVVGDIDQCLVAGTKVAMADGSERNIEKIRIGDEVRSNYGSGDTRAARVIRAKQRTHSGTLVRITTAAGRILTSTPEHVHFAGYRLGLMPQLYFTYLMAKNGVGWRLGVSRAYTNGQRLAMAGFQQRCNQEHGDAVWVLGTHDTSRAARVMEYKLSLSYGIPTLPFVARKGSGTGGYVHDQGTIDSVFASFDTESGAKKLMDDLFLSPAHPHHRAQATRSDRRNINITLCGDRRGETTMHRISVVGSDEEGSILLRKAGFSVRPAKKGSASWRFESAHKSYGALLESVERLRVAFPSASIVRAARLGGKKARLRDGNSLPLLPAASVRPGMAVFDSEGGYDLVDKVERVPARKVRVYDIDIEGTHNFVANGIATHNCIYSWRGATIDNLLAFDETYPSAKTIMLEHNYRSTATIVSAANAVIEKNRRRKEKRSVTENAPGDPITLHVADNAEDEARWIAHETGRVIRNGTAPEEIAVLFRTNFQSRALEEAFLAEGISYKLLGTRFYDRKEVKDVLAWVRLSLEPSREADRMRAVQAPTRGIGKTTLGKLSAGKRDELRAGEKAKVAAFEAIVGELSRSAESAAPSEFVRLVVEKSGLKAELEHGNEEEKERFENIQELATLATRYDDTPGRGGIAAFLADAALAGDQDELDRVEGKTGVTLMTVHAAKGLEFDLVFVSGLEEGLFPHERNEEDDDEEERRLFYVAMTRAKKRLVLTLARIRRIYGADFITEPSNFLHDIDPALMRHSGQERIIEA
ncbi:MAG: UvrD-helicase domain-containing protein [bacterium]